MMNQGLFLLNNQQPFIFMRRCNNYFDGAINKGRSFFRSWGNQVRRAFFS